jgi:hypothetical protein
MKSLKFSRSFFSTKKKKEEKPQKTIMNSTLNVVKPLKQSFMVAMICMKAFWKLSNLLNLMVDVKT